MPNLVTMIFQELTGDYKKETSSRNIEETSMSLRPRRALLMSMVMLLRSGCPHFLSSAVIHKHKEVGPYFFLVVAHKY